ncbi:putative glycosyltransferase [Sphingobium sp. SYK-6]|uniref:glycosyltransferase family 4 protein n=1 Tax=Sphingobium sp. (strain NBRC 103272 / SYK-6) TaxID=627192 RepID=UPI0002276F56|nr:glycosyltransferase family 4 protein [Sphingobium sp. SYK-6]BAK66258.1 putative glycosyltransferase [Sphingobium sp. SYK-6]
MKLRVVLTGNTCFKIANFRQGLLNALLERGCDVVVLAPPDGYRDRLEAMGCRVQPLPMDRNGTSPLAETALLWRIHRFLRRERPDIVFGYTIKNNIYAGLACRQLGISFVPNVTGLGPAFNDTGALNRLVRGLYGLAFARARAVFFQNPDDRAIFLDAGLVEGDRARLLPGSGVDLHRFAQQPMPQGGSSTVFLLVARLLWDKGVGLFVEAARAVRARHPEARFQLLGPLDPASRSGIPLAQIEDWVREGVIDYLGQTEDVRPALASADCVVLPSWYREGTPRVLLEAAATGRPVITTDMPGCRDAVDPGRTGFICAPRDRDALVAELERFLALSPDARIAMGRAARARAEASFDEQAVISAYFDHLPSRMKTRARQSR